jgi:heterodisulfide reductase subunit B2
VTSAKETRYAYYPGCSLLSSAKEYDRSVRAVFAHLGIDLVELDDWNCCGAVHASVNSRDAGISLPARNLALAQAQGFDRIVAPCSGCYKNLRQASKAIEADKALRQQFNDHLRDGLQLTENVTVLHPLYVLLTELGLPAIRKQIVNPLDDLKVASYYGCMLTRPKDIFDSTERPTGLDDLVRALGAQLVDYSMKAKCCGGALALSHSEVTAKLTGNVLVSAKDAGADVVMLACPMCHTALDAYQAKAARAMGRSLDLPVLYFTQVMGLALGLDPKVLGFERHMVSPRQQLVRLGF